MAKSKRAIPEGLRSVTPQLVVKDAAALLQLMKHAFGAETRHTFPGPDGKGIMHGHVGLGDSVVFVADAGGFAQPTSANLFLYVTDVDATVRQAEAAGARVLQAPMDMFWGDRWSMLLDPFGNTWQVATHVEDVGPEEMMQRMAATKK